MIGYLEGKLLHKGVDRILLLVGHVGYEVMIPAVVMENLSDKSIGDDVLLHIYYQQTARQPKPILIGFNQKKEKDFFRNFISVDAIGPLKAVKALDIPIVEIASAIESGDIGTLKKLGGVGTRTAHKILASLRGKMGEFVSDEIINVGNFSDDFAETVLDVLVIQLGYKKSVAHRIISDVLSSDRSITTAEGLFDRIYNSKFAY